MRTTIKAALLALAAWFSALAALTYAAEPRDVVAWVPQARLAEMLSAHSISVIDAPSGGFVRLRGDTPGFARTLYASGAWMVLPAARGGCLRNSVPGT